MRFLTDASIPGVERLAVTAPRQSLGLAAPLKIPASRISAELPENILGAQAHGPIFVKGWTRSVACMAVLLFTWEADEMQQAGSDSASFVRCQMLLEESWFSPLQAMPHDVRKLLCFTFPVAGWVWLTITLCVV